MVDSVEAMPALPYALLLAVILVLAASHTPWAGRSRSMTEGEQHWEVLLDEVRPLGADRLWRAEGEVPMARSVGDVRRVESWSRSGWR